MKDTPPTLGQPAQLVKQPAGPVTAYMAYPPNPNSTYPHSTWFPIVPLTRAATRATRQTGAWSPRNQHLISLVASSPSVRCLPLLLPAPICRCSFFPRTPLLWLFSELLLVVAPIPCCSSQNPKLLLLLWTNCWLLLPLPKTVVAPLSCCTFSQTPLLLLILTINCCYLSFSLSIFSEFL